MPFSLFKWLLATWFAATAWAQPGNTENQVWPEADIYFKLDSQTRLIYSLSGKSGLGSTSGNFANGVYLEFFLPHFRPVFFRRIIKINDARIQRIVLDVGERVMTSVNVHPATLEERTLVQATLRWAFPYGTLFTDRNRVEFRFVNGVYSWRARDQLRLEKDVRVEKYALTEYLTTEAFFDSKTDSVNRFRYTGGVVLPLGKKTTVEPYWMRQNSLDSRRPVVNAIGLTLSLFLGEKH